MKDRGYKLIRIADTVSRWASIRRPKTLKSLPELKNGARIAVPNDLTNGGRALLFLQKQGLIKLRADAGLKATPLDIVENPKKLKIVELDASQIPRSLADVDAAAINKNFAMEAGLNPKEDAIAIEDPRGRQGQAVGEEIRCRLFRCRLSVEGSEAVHRRQVRRRGNHRLVSACGLSAMELERPFVKIGRIPFCTMRPA